jgi:hypothetical protein
MAALEVVNNIPRPIECRAVSLSFLNQFCLDNEIFVGGCNAEIKTEEVVEKIVKPACEVEKCNFVEHYLMNKNNDSSGAEEAISQVGGSDEISTATHFVSHAWSYPFLVIIDTLRGFVEESNAMAKYISTPEGADAYAKLRHCTDGGMDFITLAASLPHESIENFKEPLYYFWFDIFAINQHAGTEQVDDLNHLDDAIRVPKKTIAVLYPYDKPENLSRSWCLHEIIVSVKYECELIIRLKTEDRKKFVSMLDDYSQIDQWLEILKNINVKKAEAKFEADRIRILNNAKEMKGEIPGYSSKIVSGCKRVNWLVKNALLNALNEYTSVAFKVSQEEEFRMFGMDEPLRYKDSDDEPNSDDDNDSDY